MKKKIIVIICVFLITVVGSFLSALDFSSFQKGLWSYDSLFLFCLHLGLAVPFVTGALSLVDFGVSFLPSMRYSSIWRCMFGGFGVFLMVLYVDAFLWHTVTEYHTYAGVGLTIAIWVCWIIRLALDCRQKRNQAISAS